LQVAAPRADLLTKRARPFELIGQQIILRHFQLHRFRPLAFRHAERLFEKRIHLLAVLLLHLRLPQGPYLLRRAPHRQPKLRRVHLLLRRLLHDFHRHLALP
jgi:hypothetical protein